MSETINLGLVDDDYQYDASKDDVMTQKLISYSAILLTMLAFIFSCIGISKGHQKNLEKTLYTFAFPYFTQVPHVQTGMVVSIRRDTSVFTGAGVAVSQNVTVNEVKKARDIITLNYDIDDNAEVDLLFAASKGHLLAFETSYDEIELSKQDWPLQDKDGSEITPEGMHWMKNKHIAVVGSGKITLFKANVKVNSKLQYDVSVDRTETPEFPFTENTDKSYSKSDTISNERMVITWEEEDGLYTGVIEITFPDAGAPTIEMKHKMRYSDKGAFHQICGLEGRRPEDIRYMVAKVGRVEDGKIVPGPISVATAGVRDGKLSVGNWTNMPFEWSFGYFELDNLTERDSVMCYTQQSTQGIYCTMVMQNMDGSLSFGSHLKIHSGGAATIVQRMKLMVINRTNFGLLYGDNEVGGAIVWAMAGTNDAGDLVRHGPEFVVSQRSRDMPVLDNYIGVSRIDGNKVSIIELVNHNDGANAYLHNAYLYPRPLGIAQRTVTGTTQIQFGGIWNTKKTHAKKLVPGYLYYCNDRGLIVQGGPHGYMNRNFGIQYVRSREDESLLSLHNQVGIAVSEYELLIRFH